MVVEVKDLIIIREKIVKEKIISTQIKIIKIDKIIMMTIQINKKVIGHLYLSTINHMKDLI